MRTLLLMALLFGVFNNSNAQDLVYKPKNPAFGGDTFNYQWLLSSADTQNDFKEDSRTGFEQKSELERFKENLNNQLLNKISNSLFEDQFGDKGIAEGSYVFGSLAVDIYPSNLGLVVDILDTDTGEQTQIFIPGNN
ncbi:curli production assembly/transport component CsgF [Flavobacterium sinopsychrotolerans]|jgi:curli production assembly/transport component CsgF|uniref:Curli production assembly/transport component CsgF n=2 Tax=Flavobacterium TaxID=237 RepID=A0A495S963_9FLAO|nr:MULTISPECIES: curli production assembly/transport component CsgF [Flavobacterium]RKS95638.1 curli production assembly/transport component CsgF [Flavobacterium limicola]SEO65848.1 curli production assembly/transport component CsgF [Flavobacterium sinopsychrotolerans]